MNDDKLNEVLKQTQVQAEEAASLFTGLLRKGAEKVKEAADAAAAAIRDDLNSRP